MFRIVSAPLLFVVACLLAGAYGVVHNQISYSVSPEYFTKFKFEQFHIHPHLHNRVGAAWVGWQASWWMGLVIGFFLIPAGMLLRDNRGYVVAVLRAYAVVLCTTMLTGGTALLIATWVIPVDFPEGLAIGDATINGAAAFRHAGAMHNFSYLGGLAGIITGLASILKAFLAENVRYQLSRPGAPVESHTTESGS